MGIEVLKLVTAQEERSPALIATFEERFAAGWKMAVPEAFKAALDIKLTDRIVTDNISKKKRTEKIWTQGRAYAFSPGDLLYDTREAYTQWDHALQHIKLGIKVIEARPANIVAVEKYASTLETVCLVDKVGKDQRRELVKRIVLEKSRYIPGYMKIQALRPNGDKSKLVNSEILETTQEGFVTFLQTGQIQLLTREVVQLVDGIATT